MKKIVLIFSIMLLFINVNKAQEYNASKFGCVSDGIVNNTAAIQYAIDFIAQKGGGKLNFYVGRYLTGSLHLRSNVTIELHEGAIFLASSNINDYDEVGGVRSLLIVDDISHFNLIGKGVIEFQTNKLISKLKVINENGYLSYEESKLPHLLAMKNSSDIKIDGIMFLNGGSSSISVLGGINTTLENLIIKSKSNTSSGIVLQDTKSVTLRNLYIDVHGRALTKSSNTTILKIEKCITPDGKTI